MTVIAFDGRSVAADRRATLNGTIFTTTKLLRFGRQVLAFSGDCGHGMMLVGWYMAGAKPNDWPQPLDHAGQHYSAFLHVLEWGKPVLSYELFPAAHPVEGRWAAGCGRPAAMAAMAMGADAKRAVEVAVEVDSNCGNGVTVVDLQELAREYDGREVRDAAPAAPGPAAAGPPPVHLG